MAVPSPPEIQPNLPWHVSSPYSKTCQAKGSVAVVYQHIAHSPHRDAILRDLFDYCFLKNHRDDDDDEMTDEEMDEFVLIDNPDSVETPKPLNLSKYQLFNVVLALMSVSGAVGAEMSRKYLRTASSRYRGPVLYQCAKFFPQEFTDEELFAEYQLSSVRVKFHLVELCKRIKSRQTFLQQVYELTNEHGLLYWLKSDYFEQKFETRFWSGACPTKALKLWGKHGDVYIKILRRKMQAHARDSLKLGKILKSFYSHVDLISVQPHHVQSILQIVNEYPAYQGQESLGREACNYLEETSSKGIDVSDFEGIHPVPINLLLLQKLTEKDRKKLILEYMEQRDWDSFLRTSSLVPLFKLPYQELYTKATPHDLWSVLGLHEEAGADPFLKFFCKEDLFDGAPNGAERMAVLKAWCGLHLRATPTEIESSTYHMSRHWRRWYKSYCSLFLHRSVDKVLRLVFSGLYDRRIPVYAQYAYDLLELAKQGLTKVLSSQLLEVRLALDPMMNLLKSFSPVEESPYVDPVRRVADKTVQIVAQLILPNLDDMMQFDAAIPETYITNSTMDYFRFMTRDVFGKWSSSREVLKALAKTVLAVAARASKRYGKSIAVADTGSPPRKKRKITFFQHGLHASVTKICVEMGEEILSVVQGMEPELEESHRLWGFVSGENDSALAYDFKKYLKAYETYLPKSLLATEEPKMISRAKAHILEVEGKNPSRWKDVIAFRHSPSPKLIEKIIANDSEICEKVKETLILEFAGFENEHTRLALKNEAFVKEPESRITALIQWMDEAYKTGSLWHVANALSFVVSRIKNESGIHRRTFFAHFENNFVSKIVVESLKETSLNVHVHERLSAAVVAMQQNDLSRLDSVARMVFFPALPHAILDRVLKFDPKRPCLERRQLWTDCALKLHWKYETALRGDESLACYEWPIYSYRPLESASWISLEEFETVYPLSDVSCDNKVRHLNQSVCLSDFLFKNFDVEKVFGPAQCVSMLERSLSTVWDESLPLCALRVDGVLAEVEDDVISALHRRLFGLYDLCGTHWQESELLSAVFDNAFAHVREDSPEHHLEHAHFLLSHLFTIHRSDYQAIPRLVEACDKFFRVLVATGHEYWTEKWLDYWISIHVEQGSWTWDFPGGSRLKSFLCKFARHNEPKSWRKSLSRTDRFSRECQTTRVLLTMSPSAVFIPSVQAILYRRRQDVLLRYLRQVSNWHGVFRKADNYETVDELLFHSLSVSDLARCHAEISQRYAKFAFTAASNSKLDVQAKIEAVGNFMKAPSTQHEEVLGALQSNLEDAVREALINCIFDLDSPWFILGSLFGQNAIEKNDQRVTAGLLGYVEQHVQVDKAVRLGAILLKDSKRAKLSFQLHKGVLRMLFDAKTFNANRLLQEEWSKNLPDPVRILFAEKCVESVAAGSGKEWELTVLSEVARTASFSSEIKFCLFAPSWSNCPSFTIYDGEDVPPDAFLEDFQEKGPSPIRVTSPASIKKFHSILEELESSSEGAMRFLARLKRLSLSNVFSNLTPLDDQDALDEISEYLKTAMDFDHQTQAGRRYLATLFAYGVCSMLMHNLPSYSLYRGSVLLSEKCRDHPSAIKFRDCFHYLLGLLLDTPIRQRQKRMHVFTTLLEFGRQITSDSIKEYLIREPFANELKMLEKDSQLSREVCRLRRILVAGCGGRL